MDDMTTTSDLRVALCGTICRIVQGGDPATKRALAETLDALPFERMTDATLIETARRFIDDAWVDDAIERLSAVRFEVTQLFLCPSCHDQHWIDTGAGFARCLRCNPIPEPVEPAPAKGRR